MLLCDCGANAECTPEYLLQFAYLGNYYAKRVLGVERPRVALLNIGAEAEKGDGLRQEARALLTQAAEAGRLNFVGNLEASDAMLGGADVLVADGFTGNVMLKSLEGTAKFLLKELKKVFLSSMKTKIAAGLVKGDLRLHRRRGGEHRIDESWNKQAKFAGCPLTARRLLPYDRLHERAVVSRQSSL